ncbi:extracellular solute-binding protein [Cohnella sp. CFH 77786]|uniref:extracellular solute-binding protein n=1 Tax=Cohnella sp. CFH 77786 TaxID=2662265 RepID=UPI001C60E8A9|nr:extracellular solute-binding protein [Cohnella sp. CFH 77786]MBW5444449.1 extracellular solute-binding protein [Cohnella sp. CFH 77786]
MKRKGLKGLMLLMIALMLTLSACGGGGKSGGDNSSSNSPAGSGSSASPSGNAEKTGEAKKLGIMWWGPDARHEATLKALEIYTKQHPSITFTPDYMAWDGYWQKLPALAASKTVPDVLQMDAAYIQDYAAKGVLEDLSDLDLSGIVDPSVLENLKIGGKLYGIPLSQNAQGIAFNKPALEAAGIKLPQKNWTWDDYFAFAREARAKLPKGKYGIGDSTNLWDWYNWYQTANGAKPLMSDNGKTFTLDKDLFMKYHTTFEQLRKEQAVPPADKSLSFVPNDPNADPMATGIVMTGGATTGSVAALYSMMPDQIDVVGVPTGVAGGGWAQSTIFLSVSANSENKEEAKAFLKWFITDPEAGQALKMTRGIPINPAIYKTLEPTMEPKDLLGKKVYDMALEKALPFYPIAQGFTEWVDTYKSTMEGVMFGKTSIEDAYEKLNELGQQIAAKNP